MEGEEKAKPRICIVVPTYNEKENIEAFVRTTEKVLKDYGLDGHIIIVDDNSPDGTGEIAEELAREYGNITVIHRRGKLGLGSALKQGFKLAISKLNADVVFQMDADLSHDPRAIPDMLDVLSSGYDVVIGSRYMPGGGVIGWPPLRWFVSKGANLLGRGLLGLRFRDITNGFRVFRREAFRLLDLSEVKADGYDFQVETLYRCASVGLKVGEVPVIFRSRTKGKSKIRLLSIASFIKTTFSLFMERLRKRRSRRSPQPIENA